MGRAQRKRVRNKDRKGLSIEQQDANERRDQVLADTKDLIAFIDWIQDDSVEIVLAIVLAYCGALFIFFLVDTSRCFLPVWRLYRAGVSWQRAFSTMRTPVMVRYLFIRADHLKDLPAEQWEEMWTMMKCSFVGSTICILLAPFYVTKLVPVLKPGVEWVKQYYKDWWRDVQILWRRFNKTGSEVEWNEFLERMDGPPKKTEETATPAMENSAAGVGSAADPPAVAVGRPRRHWFRRLRYWASVALFFGCVAAVLAMNSIIYSSSTELGHTARRIRE